MLSREQLIEALLRETFSHQFTPEFGTMEAPEAPWPWGPGMPMKAYTRFMEPGDIVEQFKAEIAMDAELFRRKGIAVSRYGLFFYQVSTPAYPRAIRYAKVVV